MPSNDKLSLMSAAAGGDLAGSTTRIEITSLYTTVPVTLACSLQQLRTTMFAGGSGYTATDPLTCGAISTSGNFALATNKFTVAAASGNTVIAGTLALAGDFAIATSKFTVAAASGNTLVAGTLGVTGDFAVNTDKFTVTASTGAVAASGPITVTSATNGNIYAVSTGADSLARHWAQNDAVMWGWGVRGDVSDKWILSSNGSGGWLDYLSLVASTGAATFANSVLSTSATGGIGYGTGAGLAVTQLTSRTTGVTINAVCGAITLVSAAGSASWQTFTVTNSAVAATDVVRVVQKSGTDLNQILVTAVAAGSFNISFATTGGTTTEQPVFNFAVIKAVAA